MAGLKNHLCAWVRVRGQAEGLDLTSDISCTKTFQEC